MKTKIEGILIRKVPYQDRHVIGTLLLRSGRTLSVLFYGGQGGGKKHKASTLELGYMMKIELSQSKKNAELHRAKEWLPLWSYEHIRLNHKAFTTMCFYLEMVSNIAPEEDLFDQHSDFDESMVGLFRVLSNAVVHLEERLKVGRCDPKSEMVIFLGKLLVEQGVFPSRENCAFCDIPLEKLARISLVTDHGGFGCSDCVSQLEEAILSSAGEGRELWELLGSVANQRYQALRELTLQDRNVCHTLLNYSCYQLHLDMKRLKTLKMVLSF
ncbi:MAG: hypothetical protein VXV96_04845 [Bdellovibrionota bacterium]|nr:hypothetical protein [Bdellovibrionota bacterium]